MCGQPLAGSKLGLNALSVKYMHRLYSLGLGDKVSSSPALSERERDLGTKAKPNNQSVRQVNPVIQSSGFKRVSTMATRMEQSVADGQQVVASLQKLGDKNSGRGRSSHALLGM